jgi:hypothetical protein
MRIWLLSAILALTVTAAGTPARANVEKGETLPQSRALYVRGLVGGALSTRFNPEFESVFGFGYGVEAGFKLIHLEPGGEFNAMGLGIHIDSFSIPGINDAGTTTTTILGQFLFFKESDFGAYFGPEAGMRSVSDDFGNTASSFLFGIVGGVEIPLTTHLTYGPHLEVVGAAPIPVALPNGTAGIETAIITKIYLAVSFHL